RLTSAPASPLRYRTPNRRDSGLSSVSATLPGKAMCRRRHGRKLGAKAWLCILVAGGGLSSRLPGADADADLVAAAAAPSHWSFRPIERPPLPMSPARTKLLNPVDAFVLAQLAGNT